MLLLIRQNIWNWPIGLLYSVVSIVVFLRAHLYADLALHVFYVVMNAYGWYYWAFAERPVESSDVPVTHMPPPVLGGLIALSSSPRRRSVGFSPIARMPRFHTGTARPPR